MDFKNKNLLIGIGALIIIVVIGGYLLMRPKATIDDSQAPTIAQNQESPAATEIGGKLNAQNSSGETGSVTLKDVGGKTQVTLTVDGEPTGAEQPAHIHTGTCAKIGAVKYPLTNVVGGKSDTTVDASIDDMKKLGDLSVNVHKSAKEIGIYVACADLNLETGTMMDSTDSAPSPASDDKMMQTPSTGNNSGY